MRAVLATLIFALSFAVVAPAKPVSEHHHKSFHRVPAHRVASTHHHVHLAQRTRHAGAHVHVAFDGRPALWCGWFMRQVFGVADRAYNRASNWAHWGVRASGPQVGAVIVWWHHVGLIEGGPDKHGRWLVRSGNDAHGVRTRYLSIKGAIAFRTPDRWSKND
jgi:hypothetical protein